MQQDLSELAEGYVIQSIEDQWKMGKKNRVQVYFDTYDVIRLIQGILAFEYGYKFHKDLFWEDATLVRTLAFEGWLEQIHMLPPHQDELVCKLKEDSHLFPARRDVNADDLQANLLHYLKLDELVKKNKNPTEKEFKEYVHSLQTRAQDLFKADNILKYSFWLDRYDYLFEKKQLVVIDDTTYDLPKILGSSLFGKFKAALDKYRPGFGKSNYVDAIAFCVLQERLEYFNGNQKERPLPVFYVNRPGAYNALKKVMREEGVLSYKHEGQQIPIIRQASYFILDAIFSPKDADDPTAEFLRDLKTSVDQQYQSYQTLNLFNKNYMEEFQTDLNKRLDDQFFREIWLAKGGYARVHSTLREYIDLRENREKIITVTDKERSIIAERMGRNVEKFNLIIDILTELYKIDETIEKFGFKCEDQVDVFTDFGMTRFSFTRPCCSTIQGMYDRLIQGYLRGKKEEDDDFRLQIAEVVRYIIDGIYQRNHDHLAIGLAVLWIFDKFDLIVKIGKIIDRDFDNYRIPLMHASALSLSRQKNRKRVEEIIQCIHSKFQYSNYKISLGLAYVYRRLWNAGNLESIAPELMNDQLRHTFRQNEDYKWMQEALERSKSAIDFLSPILNKDADKIDHRLRKILYAQNLYVLTLTQVGKEEEFDHPEVVQMVTAMQTSHGNLAWQARFNDTLARYYLRKALLSKNEENYKAYLKMALDENEKSIALSKRKEIFDVNLKPILLQKGAEGFDEWQRAHSA